MKLAEWLETPNPDGSKKSRGAFAERIGVTPQMISAYCNDRMWPGRERMEAIVRETGGAVTANDFIDLEQAAAGGAAPASSLRPDLWARPEDVPATSEPQSEDAA